MTQLLFSKMHGLGNDFIIIDALRQPQILEKSWIATMADRHQGIGFDQLLLLLPSQKADLRCQIFNADGSMAENCGNGLRCVARYVHEEKLCSRERLTIETEAGLIAVEIPDYDHIRVNMGVPQIQTEPARISVDGLPVALTVLSLGNPHAVQRVTSCESTPVAIWGANLQMAVAFPQGVNAGFMEVVDRKTIRLRTYERGVGETLACGSNACAAVIAGIAQGWLDSPVQVNLARGSLQVEWAGETQAAFLTGPAKRVFSGELEF